MVKMFTPDTGFVSRQEFLSHIIEANLPIIHYRKIAYYNVPAAFDIEVSSFYEDGEKRACMYCWQFGILNWVTMGRTWDEFTKFMTVLSTILGVSDKLRLAVYIQNFPYEFQFIRKRIKWDKLFFLDERKPVYGIAEGIEYRCMLKLAQKSLANIGKDLQKYHVLKREGDLDYELIRHSKTPLTDDELGYCENDIRVCLAYIQEKIETDGNIGKIPMTNTGYVRNYCRRACKKSEPFRNLIQDLTLDADEYSQLKRGFAGGFTHANAHYVGQKIPDVSSFDFTSSYPYVMLSEKFPMSKSSLVDCIESDEQLSYYLNNYCCLFDVTFYELTPKLHQDHPISESKCFRKGNCIVDNGRIVYADMISTTITEQDYWVITAFYEFESMEIHNFRIYEKGYLPKPFVMAILKLYKDKTVLKDVQGEEVNYMVSKSMLNSAYGMTVTDIVRDIIEYEDDEFSLTKPDLEEAIEKYNKSLNRFLFYPWGVWVTSYARANLFSGIVACGSDYVYSDTDSIKICHASNHMAYIEDYNHMVTVKLEAAARFHRIDPSEFSPLNQKGQRKTIGVWDYEGEYDYFKTIGAKRYMTLKDGKYSITVAGLHKQKARNYIVSHFEDPFDGLTVGLKVPEEDSGRLIHTYIDEEHSGSLVDYTGQVGEYHELSSIHMEPSPYELIITEDYKNFIDYIQGKRDISW